MRVNMYIRFNLADTLPTVQTVPNLTIASGQTTPEDWQIYYTSIGQPYGIFVDVDTSAAGFTTPPVYITSLGGRCWHWVTTGASSVYNATCTDFRIYIKWDTGMGLPVVTPADAKQYQWHINWIGIEVGHIP